MYINQSNPLWQCTICKQLFANPKQMGEHMTATGHFLSRDKEWGWVGEEIKSESNPQEKQSV